MHSVHLSLQQLARDWVQWRRTFISWPFIKSWDMFTIYFMFKSCLELFIPTKPDLNEIRIWQGNVHNKLLETLTASFQTHNNSQCLEIQEWKQQKVHTCFWFEPASHYCNDLSLKLWSAPLGQCGYLLTSIITKIPLKGAYNLRWGIFHSLLSWWKQEKVMWWIGNPQIIHLGMKAIKYQGQSVTEVQNLLEMK